MKNHTARDCERRKERKERETVNTEFGNMFLELTCPWQTSLISLGCGHRKFTELCVSLYHRLSLCTQGFTVGFRSRRKKL